MYRFVSWLTVGLIAAFLLVATASFSLTTIEWLAFAAGVATLIVSAGVSYRYRRHVATLVTAIAAVAVSAWTIVASLVFSQAAVQNLALASALALGALAIAGITEHELSMEHAVTRSDIQGAEHESQLAAAA